MSEVTRRRLLAGGALAVAGAATGYGLSRRGEEETVVDRGPSPSGARGPKKCLSLGPVNAPEGDDQDLRTGSNLADAIGSGSGWVKLWVRWDQVQPLPPDGLPTEQLGDSANPGLAFLAALDAQVELARRQDPPLGVVLTSWFFPTWSNGTAELGEDTPRERAFAVPDRLTREQARGGDGEGARTPLTYRTPPLGQLGPDGPWARWIAFLATRYARHGEGVMVEVMNEPNLQWWPQQAPARGDDRFASGRLVAPRIAARMMATAQQVAGDTGVLLGGPGVSDYPAIDPVREDRRTFTTFSSFTRETLGELERIGFEASPRFVWTIHNYVDTLLGLSGRRNRAAEVRRMLDGRWSGRRRDGGPELWITEGGVDLRSRRVGDDRATQARLMQRNLERMADRAGDGAGIGMVCNYLNYSEDHYDTGLREPLAAGGRPRPVATVWRDAG